MNDITLTSAGKDILYRNTINGGQTYWVGYYGLAYVPDQSKFDASHNELIFHAGTAGDSGSGDGESGDYIYNIWQSDITNEGHSISSNSLTRLTLYDRNLSANFRYIYDADKGCNRLVTWTTDGNAVGLSGGETPSYIRTGYKVYDGVQMGDGNDVSVTGDSRIPCPAPLFYLGHGKSYTSGMTAEEFVDEVGSDWPLNSDALDSDGHPVPLVTPDMRYYFGTVPRPDGVEFGSIPSGSENDPFGVIASSETRSGEGDYIDQFAEFVSISNFNKAHGHVSSEGYGINAQESCHNMSRVTKLFPIAQYEIDAKDPSTTNPSVTERGSLSQIKYIIDLDLRGARQSMREYFATLEYQTKNAGDERESEAEAANEDIFSGNSVNSFKFNRIGIYAVPATIRHFYKQGDAENRTDCRATHYQVEISPDADPILFAVIRLDEVSMSEDASFGMDRFRTEFILHLEADADSGICKEPEVYYNLVENEAITWYQNQLLATAGLSEAVTNLGVGVAHLLNRNMTENCAGGGATQDCTEYALKDHTHDYLRNLVDGTVSEGAVRGVNTKVESAAAGVGKNSLQLGEDTGAYGDRQIVQGVSTTVDALSHDTVALGATNTDVTNSYHSAFLGTSYYGSESSSVDNKATAVNVNNTIVGGAFGKIENSDTSLIIGRYVGKELKLANITGSIAIGEMESPSILDSVVLRTDENPVDYMYKIGRITDSVVLGQGYGDYGVTDIIEKVGSDAWNSRVVNNSFLSGANRSSCLTENDYNYMQWLASEKGKSEDALLQSVIPNVYDTVMVNGSAVRMRGTIESSMLSSSGGTQYNMTQPQYIDANDTVIGYPGEGTYDMTFENNLVLTGGSNIPTGTRNSILAGGGSNFPVRSASNIWLNSNGGNGGTWEIMLPAEKFREIQLAGNLTKGNYVLLSSPGEHPVIEAGGALVELEAENGYHAGVVVDENLAVSYTPYVDRVATIYKDRGTYTYGGETLGTVTRDGVQGTDLSPLESGYGRISQHWAASRDIYRTIVLGDSNNIGTDTVNSIILGNGNDARNITMQHCLIIGDSSFYGPHSNENKANEVNTDGSARNHRLTNVMVLAQQGAATLNALFSPADMATTDYSNALVFLSSAYQIPEVLGIFPVPTCYSSYSPLDGNGPSANNSATVNRDESYFEYNPYDFNPEGIYLATGGVGKIFQGKTKPEIKGMINKTDASMIYTGGIALAGKPVGGRGGNDDGTKGNPGLIRLGSSAVPSAYITNHPVSGWVSDVTTDPIIPKIVTGTTECPYGGRVLGILDTQEPDGTLQIGLFPNGAGCMRESDLGYDASNTIITYKGKPFGGGGLTTEYTYVSVTINNSSETVTTDDYSYFVNSGTVPPQIMFYPRRGRVYNIAAGNLPSSSGATVTLSVDENMNLGDEFSICYCAYQVHGGGHDGALGGPCTVDSNNGHILCRKTSYIGSSSSTSPYGQYLLLRMA